VIVSRWRLVALLAIVAVAAGVAAGAIIYAGSSPEPLLTGGSGFSERKSKLEYIPAPRASKKRPPAPRVPLARGVAQLFVVGFSGETAQAPFFRQLRRRDWGAVVLSAANPVALADEVRTVGRQTRDREPLVVAGPGVEGMPRRGAARAATARAKALAAGRALRTRGISMVLAPSAEVGYGAGPAARAAFSSDPIVVAQSARAAVEGWRAARVAPVASSYPGTGAASADPSEGVATVGLSLDELRTRDASVFHGLARRVPVVRMSAALYAAFDGVTPATLLPEAIAMLRDAGFRGAVMSASLPATSLATGGNVAEAAVAALRAGCDLLLVPGDARDQEAAYRAVVRAIRRGKVPQARYREALARVTALRRRYLVR
jgi:beta-N-acetylhexosaminidase